MATVREPQSGRAAAPAGAGTPSTTGTDRGEGVLRRILLGLVLLGTLGLGAELVLLEHTESLWQWAPLVALGLGLVSGVAAAVRPTPTTVRAFHGVMAVLVVLGLVGLYLHYDGNAQFELEMDPALRGMALLWSSLRGATPALAPGALVQLGLLGLAYAYRHPVLPRGGTH